MFLGVSESCIICYCLILLFFLFVYLYLFGLKRGLKILFGLFWLPKSPLLPRPDCRYLQEVQSHQPHVGSVQEKMFIQHGWTLLEFSWPTHNWKSPASPTFARAKIHPDSQKNPSKEKVSDLINKKYFILDLWSLQNQK